LPKASGGEPVTVSNSMKLLDVWACVRVLSQTAATLPLVSYRKTATGRQRVEAEYLANPSPGMTQNVFIAWLVQSLALHGEAFIGKYRGPDGELRMVSLLDPSLVGVEVGPDGEPIYSSTNALGEPLVLFRSDVIHVRLTTIDGVRGVSPIAQCRDALGLSSALSQHATETAEGGYRPDGVVTVQAGPGAEDVANNLREKWSERHAKPGRTAFVTSELSYTPISIPAADAQFVEQRRLSTVEVCRVFGVPVWMIGGTTGDSQTYSSTEMQASAFVKFGLSPYTTAIEQAISLDGELMPPGGDSYCSFDFNALLRPDAAVRAQVYTAALNPQTGWSTRAEIRTLEDLPAEGSTTT
jgi:HK97 family phage portal protein